MKKIITALFALFVICAPLSAKTQEKQFFTVSADAEVRVTPDRVAITFGVYQKTQDLKKGKDQMKTTVTKAMNFLKQNGIKEKFIKTDNVSVDTRYETKYKNNREEEYEIVVYTLSQTFTVTLEDISQYDLILFSLLDMGVNTVRDVNFYSTEMRKYRDEARLLAVQHAKEKAELFAKAAGLQLGRVVNLSESNFNVYGGFARSGAMMSNMVQNMSQGYASSGDGNEDGTLEPGMISVTAGVTLTYELK